MDEAGIPLSPCTPNIAVKNGQKKVCYRTFDSGKKEQIIGEYKDAFYK